MGAAKIFFDKHFFFVQLQSKKHRSHIFTKETYNTVRAVKRYRIRTPSVFVVPKLYTDAAGKRKTPIKEIYLCVRKSKDRISQSCRFLQNAKYGFGCFRFITYTECDCTVARQQSIFLLYEKEVFHAEISVLLQYEQHV